MVVGLIVGSEVEDLCVEGRNEGRVEGLVVGLAEEIVAKG